MREAKLPWTEGPETTNKANPLSLNLGHGLGHNEKNSTQDQSISKWLSEDWKSSLSEI